MLCHHYLSLLAGNPLKDYDSWKHHDQRTAVIPFTESEDRRYFLPAANQGIITWPVVEST
jgi:hypothetical protein